MTGPAPGPVSPTHDDLHADAVRVALIRELFAHGRLTVVGGYFMAAYAAAVAWPFADHAHVLGWAAVAAMLLVIRAIFIRHVHRSAPPDAALPLWERRFIGMQVLIGCLWGAACILFIDPDQPASAAFLLVAVSAGTAGSVPAQAYCPRAFLVFVVPMMTALVVRTATAGSGLYLIVAGSGVLFAATMIGLNRAQARTVTESIRIRFENRALVDALTRQTQEAEASRRKAEAANLAKSQFLAAASHDLRQPLYALGLFSATLRDLALDEAGRAIVARIGDNVAIMERLFEGLLDLSRLQAGAVEARPQPVSVAALFDELGQLFFDLARRKGLDLRFRHDDEWILTDPLLIEQVMANLVANAIRYTGAGAILVAARRRGDTVRLEVWDTGIGIAAADAGRIFDEFVQVGNAERDREKGLGLGLSIVARAAALLGTRVALTSRPGRGSRFVVAQPATGAAARAAPRPPPPLPPETRLAGRVLVIDDEPNVRDALTRLLSGWGIAVEAVAEGPDAVARVEAGGRFDVVLSDQRLSGTLDGLATVAALRRCHPAPVPFAAIVTGDFDPALLAAARGAGIPVLHKPASAEALRRLLAGALAPREDA